MLRNCKICGGEFITTNNNQATCSDLCRNKNKKLLKTNYYIRLNPRGFKSCPICNVEFEQKRVNSDCCSVECRNKKYRAKYKTKGWFINSKKEGSNKLYQSYKEKSKEWGIPTATIKSYGINFLESNPVVREVLVTCHNMNGRGVDNEVKDIRRKASLHLLRSRYYDVEKNLSAYMGMSIDKFRDWRRDNKEEYKLMKDKYEKY